MQTKKVTIEEIADKFFEEQEKLNFSYDSRESFIEGYKLAKEMGKDRSLKVTKYDLDELAMEECNNPDLSWENDYAKEKFKAGFQKAIELLTFKSE